MVTVASTALSLAHKVTGGRPDAGRQWAESDRPTSQDDRIEAMLERANRGGPWERIDLSNFTDFTVAVHALGGIIHPSFVGVVDGSLGVDAPGWMVTFKCGSILGYDALGANVHPYDDVAEAVQHVLSHDWIPRYAPRPDEPQWDPTDVD